MNQESRWWSVVMENASFVDTREYVGEFLINFYKEVGQERVVSSTVFYPLKLYTPNGLDYKMLQVWVTPRHAERVIVKVVIKGRTHDLDYERQVGRAFEKIVEEFMAVMGKGKVNII